MSERSRMLPDRAFKITEQELVDSGFTREEVRSYLSSSGEPFFNWTFVEDPDDVTCSATADGPYVMAPKYAGIAHVPYTFRRIEAHALGSNPLLEDTLAILGWKAVDPGYLSAGDTDPLSGEFIIGNFDNWRWHDRQEFMRAYRPVQDLRDDRILYLPESRPAIWKTTAFWIVELEEEPREYNICLVARSGSIVTRIPGEESGHTHFYYQAFLRLNRPNIQFMMGDSHSEQQEHFHHTQHYYKMPPYDGQISSLNCRTGPIQGPGELIIEVEMSFECFVNSYSERRIVTFAPGAHIAVGVEAT